jgi:hypothetical protein
MNAKTPRNPMSYESAVALFAVMPPHEQKSVMAVFDGIKAAFDDVRDAKCGESDTFENATREAGEYVADKLVRDMFTGVRESTRGSSIMTITHPPQRNYRFVTSDKSQ